MPRYSRWKVLHLVASFQIAGENQHSYCAPIKRTILWDAEESPKMKPIHTFSVRQSHF